MPETGSAGRRVAECQSSAIKPLFVMRWTRQNPIMSVVLITVRCFFRAASRADTQGGNRGIGLGFVRQLLARPKDKYPLILTTSRNKGEEGDELSKLVNASEGRLKRLVLEDVADYDAVLVGCLGCPRGGTVAHHQRLVGDVRLIAPKGLNILQVLHTTSSCLHRSHQDQQCW